eukprot:s405_g5.t1
MDRLQEHLARTKSAGKISLHEGQVLHGLLRYACGFFAGRDLFQVCAEVMNLATGSAKSRLTNVSDFCDYASEMLRQSQPRKLSASGERRPFLMFRDGAWEANFSGIGAVVIHSATGEKWMFSGQVLEVLVQHWEKVVGSYATVRSRVLGFETVTNNWAPSRIHSEFGIVGASASSTSHDTGGPMLMDISRVETKGKQKGKSKSKGKSKTDTGNQKGKGKVKGKFTASFGKEKESLQLRPTDPTFVCIAAKLDTGNEIAESLSMIKRLAKFDKLKVAMRNRCHLRLL